MDETELVQQLHDLAQRIAAAKAAGDAPAVADLWAQFQTVAHRYTGIGASDLAALNLINSVSAGVESFLKAVPQAAGTAVGDVLGGLFTGLGPWTLALGAGAVLWFAWPLLLKRRARG